MGKLLLCISAITPPIFFVFYIYRKDKARPEPKKHVLRLFLIGAVSCIIISLIGIPLLVIAWSFERNVLLYSIFEAFLVAGFVEEGVKILLVRRYVYKKPYFDEVMDGIVYTVAAGMGFACIENVLYVMQNGIGCAVLRAILSVPGHAAWSAVMGYYIGMSKLAKAPRLKRKYLFIGFLIAFLLHGLYDVFLFIGGSKGDWIIGLASIPVIIFSIVLAKKKIKLALQADE